MILIRFFLIFVVLTSSLLWAQEILDVPRETMPEPVYRLIRDVFESNTNPSFNKSDALKTLDDTLRIIRYPDFKQLEYLEISHTRAITSSIKLWGKREKDHIIVVADDFTSRVLTSSEYSRVVSADSIYDLSTMKKSIESIQKEVSIWKINHPPTPKSNETGISLPPVDRNDILRNNPNWKINFYNLTGETIYNKFFHRELTENSMAYVMAYSAACIGQNETAKVILGFLSGLRYSDFFSENNIVSRAYFFGFAALGSSSNPFSEACKRWQTVLTSYPGSLYENKIKDLLKQYQHLAEAEKNPLDFNINSATCTLQDKINYDISKLPYITNRPGLSPEEFILNGESVDLVTIGLPAIPALINQLLNPCLTTAHKHDHYNTKIFFISNIPVQEIALHLLLNILQIDQHELRFLKENSYSIESDYKALHHFFQIWWEKNKALPHPALKNSFNTEIDQFIREHANHNSSPFSPSPAKTNRSNSWSN